MSHFSSNLEKGSRRSSLSHNQKPKIDPNARLRAIFEKFPKLAVELHEPNPQLTERFKALFQDPRDPTLGSPSDMEPMISGDSPWDAEAATDFLLKNEHRISELTALIGECENYEPVQFSGLSSATRLLSMSYALNLKLGNYEQAQSLYSSALKLNEVQANTNLIQTSISTALTLSLNRYNLKIVTQNPELVTQFEAIPYPSPSMSKTMLGEFSSSLRMVYGFSEIGDDGVTYFDISDVGDILDSSEPSDNHIPLDTVEDIIATQFIDLISYLKECESSEEYISGDEMDAELKSSLTAQPDRSEIEKQLADALFVGVGYYGDALREAQQVKLSQSIAIQIAYTNHLGQQWDGDLPTNYKTGEPIIWDKENNQLLTGLEGDNGTIDIPVIE